LLALPSTVTSEFRAGTDELLAAALALPISTAALSRLSPALTLAHMLWL